MTSTFYETAKSIAQIRRGHENSALSAPVTLAGAYLSPYSRRPMQEPSEIEDLLARLGKENEVVTMVELDGSTCISTELRYVLDAIVLRGSLNDNLQVFSLKDILIESDALGSLCEALALMRDLRELTLSSIGLSANALRKLCKIFNQLQNLSLLSLDGNSKLGPRGIKILSESYLAKNKSLTHLDLSHTSMGHFGAQALALPTLLQTLLLQGNGMGHDGIWKLAEPLQALEYLHTLNLGSNNCLDDGCLEIAKHVSFWQHLRHLNLSDNDIGDVGVEVLAREMEGSLVRELYLQDNQITDAGAAHLAERLLLMANLQVLHLANNKLRDAGCIAIARGLVNDEGTDDDHDDDADESEEEDFTEAGDEGDDGSHSQRVDDNDTTDLAKARSPTKLKILNLSRNKIGDGGAGAFVELLDDIPSLRILDLTDNEASEARTRILDVLLKHRQHDQQRTENEAKPRVAVLMSPTPERPARPKPAFENVSFDLTEAEDEEVNDESFSDGRELLKKKLEQPLNFKTPAIDLSQGYFNQLTGNFSPKRILSYSAVGNVYDASDTFHLADDGLVVRSLYMHTAGALNEVRASVVGELKHIQHENILHITAQLLGPSLYCFLYNLRNFQSLREVLMSEYSRQLFTWRSRMKVLGDIAKALAYCHGGCGVHSHRKPSFHGDVNPSNIYVLDDFSTAKVSGCGLSRLIATDRGRFHSGDAVFGSRGYRCPRYERGSCQYDAASDMFSFGIIASEILTGCLQGSRKDQSGILLNDTLYDNLFGSKSFQVDPRAEPVTQNQALGVISRIAASCMNPDVSARPTASALVQLISTNSLLIEVHKRDDQVPVDVLPIV